MEVGRTPGVDLDGLGAAGLREGAESSSAIIRFASFRLSSTVWDSFEGSEVGLGAGGILR